ncbi:hypothetical protein BST81_00190 [Leptolyngbya sp. 'hensonii']|uniref:non-ribosomal peptide synthetase n=1 Tax=Leptolyngbya sp. 'hensonii' TaxID=1922337 RepID=UPI0009503125|nr:alpha/beta fold hydrolase [Leptolyngbya sp. 'hensonii']OLP20469.1 hypothetical protein BST81_00190 [Leptolyngbya sp. 'hensonii']
MKTLDQFLSELRQLDIKLWLEGDRLRYRAPEGTMTPELLTELKARKTDILNFLQQLNTASQAQRPPLVPLARQGTAPLSFAQKRFWLLHQFEPESSANNMPVVLRLTGQVDVPVLERSLSEMVRRHEILRTTFPLVEGEPLQAIAPPMPVTVPIDDLRSWPAEERDQEAHRRATALARQPFDLHNGPMLHVKLFRLTDTDSLFIWCLHCITGDGASSDVFYQELTSLYAAFLAGEPSPLPELPIQYGDFAQWQREWLQGEVLEAQLAYWKKQLSGNLAAIQLPTDYPRPPLQTYRGDRCPRMFSLDLHGKLLALSQQLGSTLFMTLLATFETLLYRYSGQEDILISFTNAGRNQMETEKLIGFFSGTLLLRTSFAGNPTFRDLLSHVKDEALEAYAHQDLPFEKLVEELRPEQNQSRSPLFQIKFALNPPWTNGRGMSSIHLPDLQIDSLFGYIYHGKTKFDLILVMREQVQGLGAVFDYNADLFAPSTASRMMDHFQSLLEGIVANPDQRVLDLPLLTPAEQQQQQVDWNQTQSPEPVDRALPAYIAAQVEATPEAIALVTDTRQFTYQELEQRANQLTRELLELGLQPGGTVGVWLDPSPEAVIALLGILQAGGVYVPLPSSGAPELLRRILDHAGATIVLTRTGWETRLSTSGVKVLGLDATPPSLPIQAIDFPTLGPEQPACLLYPTDSADFTPGVIFTHRNLVRLTQGIQSLHLTAEDTLLHHSSLTSLMAGFEIWTGLLRGATLAIVPPETPAAHLGQWIQHYQATTVWLPARVFHRLVDTQMGQLQSLRHILTGGDILSVPQVQKVLRELPACKLIHTYATIGNAGFTCSYPITALEDISTAIPIGRPAANTQIYVLSSQQQLVPLGVPGELYVSGEGVAQGYHNCPDRTAAQFIPHPFSSIPGDRLYRTGTLVRYLRDGNVERIGDLDQQVIIRDWRIEFGRIETILSQHPEVQEGMVLADGRLPQEDSLVAYVVLNPGSTATISEVRGYLKQKLPLLMVPSRVVFLDALPLTSEGRVDRTCLPDASQAVEIQPAKTITPSRDELEQQLTQIWEQLFGMQPISVTDNFFDLGGDSLLAVRLFAQIEATCGKKLPLSVLLNAPTIEQLAHLLRQDSQASVWSPLVQIQAGSENRPPLFCMHGGGFNVLIYRKLALNLDPDQPVYGLQARGLAGDPTPLRERLEEIAADYVREIRTIQPHGPYYLSGLSNGGNIALEMAQQLQAQGEQVALLALFDSYGPNGIHLLPAFPRLLSSLVYAVRYSFPRWLEKRPFSDPGALWQKMQRSNGSRPTPAQATAESAPEAKPVSRPAARSFSLKQGMNRVSQYILEHSPWAFYSPSAQLRDMEDTVSSNLKQLEVSYSRIHKAYSPKPYSGQITLFRSQEVPPGYRREPLQGWSDIAQGGLEIHTIPGHHTSIMESREMAQIIRAEMDKTMPSAPTVPK